ncbi:MAG TPA: hypothetical protein VE994_07965 [Terriglobales bacterium]|nr:hypothetical protein [Terriglobales bacterium]
MIKVVIFLAAIGISALACLFVRRRGSGETKITDKRARAEAFKQLLALSDDGVPRETSTKPAKDTVKTAPRPQHAAPLMTRQQRRAKERKAKKVAFAKSQHA